MEKFHQNSWIDILDIQQFFIEYEGRTFKFNSNKMLLFIAETLSLIYHMI